MKKTFRSTEEIYRGAALIPLNLDAVNQRIDILTGYLRGELESREKSPEGEVNRLYKDIEFWKMMRETQCEKNATSVEENSHSISTIVKYIAIEAKEIVGKLLENTNKEKLEKAIRNVKNVVCNSSSVGKK